MGASKAKIPGTRTASCTQDDTTPTYRVDSDGQRCCELDPRVEHDDENLPDAGQPERAAGRATSSQHTRASSRHDYTERVKTFGPRETTYRRRGRTAHHPAHPAVPIPPKRTPAARRPPQHEKDRRRAVVTATVRLGLRPRSYKAEKARVRKDGRGRARTDRRTGVRDEAR